MPEWFSASSTEMIIPVPAITVGRVASAIVVADGIICSNFIDINVMITVTKNITPSIKYLEPDIL